MRPWVGDAGRYALLYAGGAVVGAVLLGLLPGVPLYAPTFVVSMAGAVLAFLSMWGDNAPTFESLPSGRTEALPVPWRMFLLGAGLFSLAWVAMLLGP